LGKVLESALDAEVVGIIETDFHTEAAVAISLVWFGVELNEG
jgi:hypothetical protein